MARCTVEPLMSQRACVCPTPNRDTREPKRTARSMLGGQRAMLAGFTHVRTWQSVVYGAVVVDMHARHFVSCRLGSSMYTDLVLEALPLALYTCRRERHSEVNPPYVSIRHSEWLAEAGIEPPVRKRRRQRRQHAGRGHQRAVQRHGHPPARALKDRRGGTTGNPRMGLSWFNHPRLPEPFGYFPPAEADAIDWRKHAQASTTAKPPVRGAAGGALKHTYMARLRSSGGPCEGWNNVRPSSRSSQSTRI